MSVEHHSPASAPSATTGHPGAAPAAEPGSATKDSAAKDSADPYGIKATVAELRATFDSGQTRPASWRAQQLQALKLMIEQEQEAIIGALQADVGKPALEAYSTEVGYTIGSIELTLAKLREWMAPDRVSTPMITQPGTSRIFKEPLGVVLIIAPWNYPFQLAVAPLIGALAAGNCALVKPSEVTPETSRLLARIIPEYLDSRAVQVMEGGVPETTALLEERFDHIFYTGNGTVGRIVMAAAAKHLTPVTLELGGKSPCIIDKDANLDVAAKRVAWGKWTNAGQTCVAPDYLLVHRDVHDEFVNKLRDTMKSFWGDDPQQSKDYGRVVNARHHSRLSKLYDDAIEHGAKLASGGQMDAADRYIAPTLLTHVKPDCALMQEEIFGPILPVLQIDSADDAISFINRRDKPLALYVFSENKAVQDNVVARTSSGGVSVNHTWLHLAVHDLPFGGVGESGMGAYHGKASFDTFCHHKSVLNKPTLIDPSLMYPPYTSFKETLLRKLL